MTYIFEEIAKVSLKTITSNRNLAPRTVYWGLDTPKCISSHFLALGMKINPRQACYSFNFHGHIIYFQIQVIYFRNFLKLIIFSKCYVPPLNTTEAGKYLKYPAVLSIEETYLILYRLTQLGIFFHPNSSNVIL